MAAPALASPLQSEYVEAERLACGTLVSACERALVELRCSLARAGTPAEVRTGLIAVEVVRDVLAGWRATLGELGGDVPAEPATFTARSPLLTGR
jgi:hypothetical protein